MSARTMAWGWQVIFSGILENKNAAKLVLLRLCDRADPDGICWPGHGKTAKELRLSKTIVKESVKIFEEMDLLTIRRRVDDAGDPGSNLYILNLDLEFSAVAEEVGQPVPHPESARGGSATAPPLGQPVPQGGALADPEPKIEPKIKSKSKRARVARAYAPADAGAAAAKPVEKGKEDKARRVWPSGLVSWVPADVTQCMRLEQDVPAGELAAAVAVEREAGRDPLPGRIAARLLRQRQAVQRAAVAEQVEARTARLDAESRARGERDMQELMALQAHQTTQDRDS